MYSKNTNYVFLYYGTTLWKKLSIVLTLTGTRFILFYFTSFFFYTMASRNQDAESRHYTTVQGATRNVVAWYVVWKMLKRLYIKMRVMNLAELVL